jgi:hypothetical protein
LSNNNFKFEVFSHCSLNPLKTIKLRNNFINMWRTKVKTTRDQFARTSINRIHSHTLFQTRPLQISFLRPSVLACKALSFFFICVFQFFWGFTVGFLWGFSPTSNLRTFSVYLLKQNFIRFSDLFSHLYYCVRFSFCHIMSLLTRSLVLALSLSFLLLKCLNT